jgi:hypothetical protein
MQCIPRSLAASTTVDAVVGGGVVPVPSLLLLLPPPPPPQPEAKKTDVMISQDSIFIEVLLWTSNEKVKENGKDVRLGNV